jgi:hypothetical protein
MMCGSIVAGSSSPNVAASPIAASHPVAAESTPADSVDDWSGASSSRDAEASGRLGVRSGSGSQPERSNISCALAAISPFFEMIEVLRNLLALGLTDCLQDAGLGDPAKVVLDGR